MAGICIKATKMKLKKRTKKSNASYIKKNKKITCSAPYGHAAAAAAGFVGKLAPARALCNPDESP